MTADEEWRLQQSASRTPIQYLNTGLDFNKWHIALRRMVGSFNMIDALLYTIPANQVKSMDRRMDKSAELVKKEDGGKEESYFPFGVNDEKHASPPEVVDLTREVPLSSEPKSEKDLVIMKSMGISPTIDAFFSSTTAFTNYRSGTPETGKESFFRQEIWLWMEASLSKGQFKWVVKTIANIFDIHGLYIKVTSLTQKAS